MPDDPLGRHQRRHGDPDFSFENASAEEGLVTLNVLVGFRISRPRTSWSSRKTRLESKARSAALLERVSSRTYRPAIVGELASEAGSVQAVTSALVREGAGGDEAELDGVSRPGRALG